MSNSKQVTLTEAGLKKLEDELEYLKTVGRTEVAEKIKEARGFGDLSENSEYDEAKNEQAQMESRIVQIEAMLKNVKIIDEEDIDTQKVSVGCRVKILDTKSKTESEFTIVGSTEADPFEAKLSDESPVGLALIGKEKGNTVTVDVPAGSRKYKILEITK